MKTRAYRRWRFAASRVNPMQCELMFWPAHSYNVLGTWPVDHNRPSEHAGRSVAPCELDFRNVAAYRNVQLLVATLSGL